LKHELRCLFLVFYEHEVIFAEPKVYRNIATEWDETHLKRKISSGFMFLKVLPVESTAGTADSQNALESTADTLRVSMPGLRSFNIIERTRVHRELLAPIHHRIEITSRQMTQGHQVIYVVQIVVRLD